MKFNSYFWICPAMLIVWAGSASVQSQVVISEFMASNTKTLADQDGDYSDWIEIYNSGANAGESRRLVSHGLMRVS